METSFVNDWERKRKIFICAAKRQSMGKEKKRCEKDLHGECFPKHNYVDNIL
jgi:hypothetical protein